MRKSDILTGIPQDRWQPQLMQEGPGFVRTDPYLGAVIAVLLLQS